MNQSLLVSIIIPTYNGSAFISDSIDSALEQTYPNIEVIVIDDGSTDGTPNVLENYKKSISVINGANQGTAGARNTGIRAAKGEYIALLDHDDVWLRNKIEVQIR